MHCGRCRRCGTQREQGGAQDDGAGWAAPGDRVFVAVLNRQDGDGGLAATGEDGGVEIDQRRAGFDPVADGDARREALALEQDGVDADVQQEARARFGLQEAGVVAGMQLHDGARARRAQGLRRVGRRFDRQAVTHHASGEDRVGNLLERDDGPGKKRRERRAGRDGHRGLQNEKR